MNFTQIKKLLSRLRLLFVSFILLNRIISLKFVLALEWKMQLSSHCEASLGPAKGLVRTGHTGKGTYFFK